MIRVLIFVLIMAAVIVFFWHDEISGIISNWQEETEEKAPGLISEGVNQAQDWWEKKAQEKADQFMASLTSKGKEKIDAWLEGNNLNQYGDEKNTVYLGGTPLFDEATGRSLERYSYLLLKFPQLINELDLSQYLEK
ncbi:hypothetical protein KKF32_04380 [Patescibacteria group bacterium]|nr:hypothetical protein [Patescibacteria group bacterium]